MLLPFQQFFPNLRNTLSCSLCFLRLSLELQRENISCFNTFRQNLERKHTKRTFILLSSKKEICEVSLNRIHCYKQFHTFTPFPEMRIFDASCGLFLTLTEYSLPSVVTTTSPSISVLKILSAVVNFAKFSRGSICG